MHFGSNKLGEDGPEPGVEGGGEGEGGWDGAHPGEPDLLEHADTDIVEPPLEGALVHPAPRHPRAHQRHHLNMFYVSSVLGVTATG